MKKNIVALSLCVIMLSSCGIINSPSYNGFSQTRIQRSFYNCTFGDKAPVVDSMMTSGMLHRLPKNGSLEYYDITFCGLEWHSVTFLFNRDNSFYSIGFLQMYESKYKAEEQYDKLKAFFDNKYGMGIPIPTTNGIGYSDGATKIVMFYTSYSYNQEASLMLTYTDTKLFEAQQKYEASGL